MQCQFSIPLTETSLSTENDKGSGNIGINNKILFTQYMLLKKTVAVVKSTLLTIACSGYIVYS